MLDPYFDILGEEPRPEPFLSKYSNPAFAGFLGVASMSIVNFVARKPLFSGIQRHIGLGGLFLAIGLYADQKRNEKYAMRDAVLRHYIELHPEDFPVPERKKFKDMFIRWVPIR